MELYKSDPKALRGAGARAALSIRDAFSLKRQSERLLAFFAS